MEKFEAFLDVVKEARNTAYRRFRRAKVLGFTYGVAGAGKTTKMLNDFKEEREGTIVAFNRKIRKEILLRERSLSRRQVYTFDALFLSGIFTQYEILPTNSDDYLRPFLQVGIKPDLLNPESDSKYSLYLRALKTFDGKTMEFFRHIVSYFLEYAKVKKKIPFEFLPYFYFMEDKEEQGLLWIDEVQDVQPIHFLLFSEEIRVYGAGDQLIYDIFGASPEIYFKLKKKAKDTVKLTTTWRLRKNLAEFVNRLGVGEEQMNSPKEGGLVHRFKDPTSALVSFLRLSENNPNSAILVRKNHQLVWVKKKAKELGYFLLPDDEISVMLYEMASHPERIPKKAEGLLKQEFKQTYSAEGKEFYYISPLLFEIKTEDEIRNDLRQFILPKYLKAYDYFVSVLKDSKVQKFKKVFLTLTTVHRFKGSEKSQVLFLYSRPKKANLLTDRNVLYVGFTRASDLLFYAFM